MIDFTKPVWTKSGKTVIIWRTDVKSSQPIAGVVHYDNDDGTISEEVETWNLDGTYFSTRNYSELDLTNEPPKTLVD